MPRGIEQVPAVTEAARGGPSIPCPGWLVLLTWLAGGVIALLGALCYGALAQRIPESVEGAVGLGTLVLLGLVFVATRRGQPAT